MESVYEHQTKPDISELIWFNHSSKPLQHTDLNSTASSQLSPYSNVTNPSLNTSLKPQIAEITWVVCLFHLEQKDLTASLYPEFSIP